MASKRQRGESSRKSPPFDKERFVDFLASQRYHKIFSTKVLIPERGLTPDSTDGEMATMIRERKWQVFTSQPEPAAVNVVKEFYANAKGADGNSVFVRGKWVNVGRKAINAYYGLSKVHLSKYTEYLEQDLDYSDIIVQLCKPGTEWKSTTKDEAINFPHGKLSRYGKAWYGFICAKLMPTLHKTNVTKERAALLFCLAHGKSIDVGAVIRSSMEKAIDVTTSGGLPHPSLITELCKQAGVPWDKEEVLQLPTAPLDHSVISRFKVWSGGISDPKGLGYAIAPTPSQAAGPSEPTGPSSDLIEELRRDSRHHTRRVDLVARRVEKAIQRIDCVAQRQEAMLSYQSEAFASMAQLMANLPAQLPDPPVLPTYPPLSPDLDANMDDNDESNSQGSPQF